MLPLPFARPFSIASSTSALGGRSSSRFGPTRAVAFAADERVAVLAAQREQLATVLLDLRQLLDVGLGDRVARRSPSRSPRPARRCRGAAIASTNSSVAPRRPRRLWVVRRSRAPLEPPLIAEEERAQAQQHEEEHEREYRHRGGRYPFGQRVDAAAACAVPRRARDARPAIGAALRLRAARLIGAAPRRSSAPPGRRRGSRPARRRPAPRRRRPRPPARGPARAQLAGAVRSGSGTTSAPPEAGAASGRRSRT